MAKIIDDLIEKKVAEDVINAEEDEEKLKQFREHRDKVFFYYFLHWKLREKSLLSMIQLHVSVS